MKLLLVISPHPDDLEISAGLLVCVAISKGWHVKQVIMTDGRHGGIDSQSFDSLNLINQRKKEALLGASILGVNNTLFLGIEDGKLNLFKDYAISLLKKIISDSLPTVMVFPLDIDIHPDHRASAEICNQVLIDYPQITPLKYSFWGNNIFNIRFSAPQFSQIRLTAIQTHKSQPIKRYVDMMIRRGGVEEDRFQLEVKNEDLLELFNPYIHFVNN